MTRSLGNNKTMRIRNTKKVNMFNQGKRSCQHVQKFQAEVRSCGRSNNHQNNCRHKDYDCNNYESNGHLSILCKKGKKDSQNFKTWNTFLSNNDINNIIIYNLSSIFFSVIYQNTQNRVNPFTVNLIIGKKKNVFRNWHRLGSCVISEKLYSQYFNYIKIKKNDIYFYDYVDNIIKPMGKIDVNSQFKGK